jgi:DNA polymerase III sliding clamp (beta) subunit (PCNA family)
MTKNKNQAVIPSAALSRALNVVSRGAGKDGLYEMMQVDIKNGVLTVCCFNGIMGVSVQTAVEDQGSGVDAMINAQALVSLVSNMSGAVTISQEARKGLKVECESVSVSLKGTMAGTLPELEDSTARDVCSMSGEALIDALQVSVSAHNDSVHSLSSVLFDISAERMTTMSADGTQGAMCEAMIENGEPTIFLLPLAFVHWMRNVPSGAKVTIKESKNRILLVAVDGNNTITMSAPKGQHQQYPNLRAIFDSVFANGKGSRFAMEASAFYKAARQVKALGATSVHLFTENGNLCTSAKGDVGKFRSVVGATNEEVSIHLNPNVISNGVSLLETPEVIYSGSKAPLGVVEGALRFVFMPLVVPDEKETEAESEAEPIAIEVAQPVAA